MIKPSDELEWNFQDPENVAVFTTASIVDGARPILFVCHDEDDCAWQFHSGIDSDQSEPKLISLHSILVLDPTLRELANLPLWWQAQRTGIGEAWQRSKQ
jgi:hypothetical protein